LFIVGYAGPENAEVFFREEVVLPDTQSPGAPPIRRNPFAIPVGRFPSRQGTTTDFQWTMTGRSRVLQRCKKAFHSETPSFPPALLARGEELESLGRGWA
jgi:hypothetical protein